VRQHRFALALLALVVAILFARPLVMREVFTFRDHSDYFQPLRYYTAVQISWFRLPYWNPYSASGEPWLANPQTGVFYPPTWIFTFLPFPTAYMLYLALHLLILGWGAYLLFARNVSREAAMAGAVALMLSGPVLSLLDVQNNFATFAWVPLVIWCGLECKPALGGITLALAFLGGEPFFAAFAAAIFAAVVFIESPSPRASGETVALSLSKGRVRGSGHDPSSALRAPSPRKRGEGLSRARSVAITAAIAIGLSAIQLLPFLEMLRGSDRAAGLPGEQIARESMRLRDWLRVAVPPRLDERAFDPNLGQHFIPLVYVGVIVALLAVYVILSVAKDLRRRDPSASARLRMTWGWIALLVICILISVFGGVLMPYLPLTLFRYPARLVPFGALAIVALAVIGWERIRPRRRWADLILIAILVADLLPRAQPILQTGAFRPDRIPYPLAVGRAAKFIRINERPAVDRDAWIAGYTNLYQRRFDASSPAPVMSARYAQLHDAAVEQRELRDLNFLGVGYVLAEAPVRPLEPFFRVRTVTAYANPQVLPLATWWSRSIHEWPGVPSMGESFVTSAERVQVDSTHARMVVNAPADGVVMIAQQDAPSWAVYVDGRESKKLLAGGIFRAVAVPRGRHEVIWRYRPRSMWLGAAMTIITLVSLQLPIFVKRRATKNFSS
jgi:hypothetical protein